MATGGGAGISGERIRNIKTKEEKGGGNRADAESLVSGCMFQAQVVCFFATCAKREILPSYWLYDSSNGLLELMLSDLVMLSDAVRC